MKIYQQRETLIHLCLLLLKHCGRMLTRMHGELSRRRDVQFVCLPLAVTLLSVPTVLQE